MPFDQSNQPYTQIHLGGGWCVRATLVPSGTMGRTEPMLRLHIITNAGQSWQGPEIPVSVLPLVLYRLLALRRHRECPARVR